MRSPTVSSSKKEAPLAGYFAKRHFETTPEPVGSRRVGHATGETRRFVVQKHRASRLHYDFRLEAGAVLKSWAVPKGPSLDPKQRRLAMQVEDHPLDYFDFEGIIPAGNYGAGEVVVWDWGTYEVLEADDPVRAIAKGKLKFRMRGEKLRGVFTLVKMHVRAKKDNAWLLMKSDDEAADRSWRAESHEASVKSGRLLADLAADPPAGRRSDRKLERLPDVKQPELATLVDAPFDNDEWLFEIKWDGFRALTTIRSDGRVEIVSRNGKDLLARFPELDSVAKSFVGAPAIVDGEIVALDGAGKSIFQKLQHRTSAMRLKYVVFDVLYAEGRDLRKEPLKKRKEVLSRIVRPKSDLVVLSDHVVGAGIKLFEEASARGLEGIVGKRRDSPYVERRTRDWVKVKAQLEQECVIAGYTSPRGARQGFGSLILGLFDHGKLVDCGKVGTGFDAASIRMLVKKLEPLVTSECPFDRDAKKRTAAHWTKPKLVAQVRFSEWTDDGSMRHPVFLGLRDDKSPRQCHREVPHSKKAVA